jgi:hypothetical protein
VEGEEVVRVEGDVYIRTWERRFVEAIGEIHREITNDEVTNHLHPQRMLEVVLGRKCGKHGVKRI